MPKALSMNKEKNNRTCANLTVMDTFSACHPFLNFFYFTVVLFFTMFNQHPVFIGISYIGAFSYSFLLNGWEKDSETKLSSYSARSSHCGTIKSHV